MQKNLRVKLENHKMKPHHDVSRFLNKMDSFRADIAAADEVYAPGDIVYGDILILP